MRLIHRHPVSLLKKGFSLIELLVVISIVSVLASIGIPLTELAHRRHQEEELRANLRQIRNALDAYKSMVDQGRITRSADASGYPPSLEILVTGVVDAQSPRGGKIYFLRKVPRDPFAQESLPPEKTWGLRSYASPPDKPQPGDDVFDVYSLSDKISLDGRPYRDW